MMDFACERAGVLLERRASGIEEHERLLLEEHLAGCPSCREQSLVVTLLVESSREGEELSPRERARALSRALAQAGEKERPEVRSRYARGLGAVAALAAVAAAVLLWVGRAPTPPLARFAAPGSIDRAAWDNLEIADSREIALAHARARLGDGGRAHWLSSATILHLDAGSVHVEVDPKPGKPFAVTTSRFRVDVIGTVFEVSLSAVHVTRGRVRITPLVGAPAEVSAGESWSVPAAEAEPAPEPAAKAGIDASALLGRARKALASGDVAKARAELAIVLGQRSRPEDLVEARTLLAECALVSGDSVAAQSGYADVAKKQAGTAAGDNAAFAAARLERDPAKARQLLTQYLASYPKGRFRQEAEARLAALGK